MRHGALLGWIERSGTEPGGWLPSALTLVVVVALLLGVHRLSLRLQRPGAGTAFGWQMLLLLITLVGLVAVVLSLPLEPGDRTELLRLLGLLASGAVALAATTFLGNILAGLLLRSVRQFRVGDFVRVEGHFGRVSEQGLFHTEIQTEDRDLTTLPHTYLATHPVTVVRASGTIVSADVGLGYDVPRRRAKELLLVAAEAAGLAESFVRLVDLRDASVVYRVGGLLTDVNELLSTRTRLRAAMLDALHDGGVEVATPLFVSTRALERGHVLVPRGVQPRFEPAASAIEDVAFDKAQRARSLEDLEAERAELEEERKGLEKRLGEAADEGVRRALEDELERLRVREAQLGERLEAERAAPED